MTLPEFITQYEIALRLSFFFSVFVLMALWEIVAPRRVLTVSKAVRWGNNLGLVVLNSVLLRVLFPTAAVGMVFFAEQQGWGLFNYFSVSGWLAVLVCVILLDFAIYLQHVMFHAIPLLWRLHRIHHADIDFDVTTGVRFHPIEIILSMLIKFAVIMLLGPQLVAIFIFEVLLNATAMFNHGNIRLPLALDRVLRLIVVTPDMHRVHHSILDDETNSNFGFSLSWWDRLFGTYRDQPVAGHKDMIIGIRTFREPRQCTWLPGMLAMPFKGPVKEYVINRQHV